ncbi:MAG: hypothetical protein V7K71_03330, partial [Nostoc sp.]|uniref:hypothetical protein n=1 Tax=Nostoc sp. TaxID=1180 RepID=UPI002FF471CF
MGDEGKFCDNTVQNEQQNPDCRDAIYLERSIALLVDAIALLVDAIALLVDAIALLVDAIAL